MHILWPSAHIIFITKQSSSTKRIIIKSNYSSFPCQFSFFPLLFFFSFSGHTHISLYDLKHFEHQTITTIYIIKILISDCLHTESVYLFALGGISYHSEKHKSNKYELMVKIYTQFFFSPALFCHFYVC